MNGSNQGASDQTSSELELPSIRVAPGLRSAIAALSRLAREAHCAYVLDDSFRLLGYNRAYMRFALENDAPRLEQDFPLGTDVLSCCPPPLRPLYEERFSLVLRDKARFDFEYDCSSPSALRVFRMSAIRLDDYRGILVRHELLGTTPHGPGIELGPAHRNRHGFVVQCAHCRKIQNHRVTDRWDWVPSAVATPPEPISHGICPPCAARYFPE